jgi:hypothetical protein
VASERPDDDQLDWPLAEYLIREAEIAAGRVQGVAHGAERTDAGRYQKLRGVEGEYDLFAMVDFELNST